MYESKVYAESPRRIQEAMISTRARLRRVLREGHNVRVLLRDAVERERWSISELATFQWRQLQDVLRHARANVPFYSSKIPDVESFRDQENSARLMHSLPTLTKADIVRAGTDLLAKGWRFPGFRGGTSGTTGTPTTIYQNLRSVRREAAFVARQLLWTGVLAHERRAWIRGDLIVPAEVMTEPYWRVNRAERTLMMSSYHLSNQSAHEYLTALEQFAPSLIQAYPSSVGFLARYLEARGRYYGGPPLRGIVTSSETLTNHDRRTVETRFGCRVFDWYGSFERVAAIGTCESGAYHLLSDYSYVELEPSDDGLFEIIGTGFNNRLMPLIRFRTGDFVELGEVTEACPCGRAFPRIKSVLGRQDDYIRLRDGRCINRMDHVFKGLSGIAEAQIIQDDWDEIRVLLVPTDGFSAVPEAELISKIRKRVGTTVRVSVECIESIPRTRQGKLRSVISKVR